VNGAGRYGVFFTKPAVGSKYAFLLMGFKILDAEPTLPLWHPPVEITAGMPPTLQAYYRRWNPVFTKYDEALQSAALQLLADAGVPRRRLSAPVSKGVALAVAQLIGGERARLAFNAMLDQKGADDDGAQNTPPHAEGCFDRDLCTRVVVAARLFVGGRGFVRTAEFLNEGLPAGGGGLTRDHAARAFKAEMNRQRRLNRRGVDLQFMNVDREKVASLDTVYREARKRSEFRHVKGEKLALEIHERFDLNEYVYRASQHLKRAA
jgi:hypothetical protein